MVCIIFSTLLLPTCHAFASVCRTNSGVQRSSTKTSHYHRISHLDAITKRQTFILDGAELSYYVKTLAKTNDKLSGDINIVASNILPDVAPRSPKKRNRVGAMTFVTANLDEDVNLKNGTTLQKDTQIIGVEAPSSLNTTDDSREIFTIDGDLQLYKDSIAILPPKISPADAISTATTSLLGVHCSQKKGGKMVIVGGGEYALFLARALAGLGNRVSLVTARPAWSTPSPSEISPKNKELMEILPPAVGPMSLGFALAIGEFDTLIDTLGDELGMGRARTVVDNDIVNEGRFIEQLKELHGCDSYISTLTRSQQYVLSKGLLFARDPVIRYQNEVEKLTSKYQVLPPPVGFGSTLQRLLDENIIYSSDQNESGSNDKKDNFVRGWSLSDLTELNAWPKEGPGRFGFPVVDLSMSAVKKKALVISKKKDASVDAKSSNRTQTNEGSIHTDNIETTELEIYKRTSKATDNPYITSINSASEMNEQIMEPKRNCILFITASYCQKCKRMLPQINRMARISSESTSDVLFAHADISGPRGKQLGKVLNADKVPSVIVFRKGEHVKAKWDEGSIVVEKNNLKRLEHVAKALETGERNVDLYDILSSESLVKK